MSEKELLEVIIAQLRQLNSTMVNLKLSVDDQHEILMSKLSTLESITDKIRENTKQ